MSTPPPPPPRRARGPVDPAPPGSAAPGPPPPPPRRSAADDDWLTVAPASATAAAAPTVAPAPAGPTRAERRGASAPNGGSNGGRGRRRGLIIGAVIVVVLLAAGGAFAAGVFSGGSGDSGPPEASTNVKLEPGEVKVRWPGLGPGQTAPDLPEKVMAVIGKYVDQAIVPGLRTGKVETSALADAFDQGALAQLDDPTARSTLLDEGLPKAIGRLTITSQPIDIVALNETADTTALVAVKIDLNVRVRSPKGFYTVGHKGELVLAPDAENSWKVTGWHLNSNRTPLVARPPWVTTTTAEKKQ